MRMLVLALAAFAVQAQPPALDPLEQWLGGPLVLYDAPAAIPTSEPGEATISDGIIYVPLYRIRTFRTPLEAAAFLSHAAAHRKLNHPAVFAEKSRLYAEAVILSPHFPRATMEANLRARLEQEAEPVAAEFLTRSGCTPRACPLLDRLLRAVPK